MKNMEEIIAGKMNLNEIKPKIDEMKILFPIDVKCEHIEEDGLSFGYPVDCGWVTIVKYDYTVGALTEDTIALKKSLKKPKRPHSGIYPIKSYEWTDEELNGWMVGLDSTWAEKQFREWEQEGLIDEDETMDEWIKDRLENYHCWPQSWKTKYDTYWAKLNTPKGHVEIILKNESLTLYQDQNRDFFFETKYHDYGRIQKADKKDAERYINDFAKYQVELEKYYKRAKQLKQNLDLLKKTLL